MSEITTDTSAGIYVEGDESPLLEFLKAEIWNEIKENNYCERMAQTYLEDAKARNARADLLRNAYHAIKGS